MKVDVKFLKGRIRRFYRFTAIDEATRYRLLKHYAHNSVKSAIDFAEELRCHQQARIPSRAPGGALGSREKRLPVDGDS